MAKPFFFVQNTCHPYVYIIIYIWLLLSLTHSSLESCRGLSNPPVIKAGLAGASSNNKDDYTQVKQGEDVVKPEKYMFNNSGPPILRI